jgi:hypothetical protein
MLFLTPSGLPAYGIRCLHPPNAFCSVGLRVGNCRPRCRLTASRGAAARSTK